METEGVLEKSLAEKCKYKLAAMTDTCQKWAALDLGLSFHYFGLIICGAIFILSVVCLCTRIGKSKGFCFPKCGV